MNYLESIDKISEWRNKINIYLDPAIQPLINDLDELIIDVKGKIFRNLVVTNAASKTRYGCRVVYDKDVSVSGINI
jgi:hypothetical protein